MGRANIRMWDQNSRFFTDMGGTSGNRMISETIIAQFYKKG